jgi:hypothetical protein
LGGITNDSRCIELAKAIADGKLSVLELENAAAAVKSRKKSAAVKVREVLHELEMRSQARWAQVRVPKAPAGINGLHEN